jgi:hypothetical protein
LFKEEFGPGKRYCARVNDFVQMICEVDSAGPNWAHVFKRILEIKDAHGIKALVLEYVFAR